MHETYSSDSDTSQLIGDSLPSGKGPLRKVSIARFSELDKSGVI
jgi:hypothetical protein